MKYLYKLKKEVSEASANGDVPNAAIILKDGVLVSSAHNEIFLTKIPLFHAEILAIFRAAFKLRTFNLSGCVMYTTLEPCDLCRAAIKTVRMKKVYYFLECEKDTEDDVEYIKKNLKPEDEAYFKEKLQYFFNVKRSNIKDRY